MKTFWKVNHFQGGVDLLIKIHLCINASQDLAIIVYFPLHLASKYTSSTCLINALIDLFPAVRLTTVLIFHISDNFCTVCKFTNQTILKILDHKQRSQD